MIDKFKAFIKERHSIYLRRAAGDPRPWTEDILLREYKFTNIYRELDRTTIWCKNNVRDKDWGSERNRALSIFAFRFFNRIATCDAVFNTGAWKIFLDTNSTAPMERMVKHHRKNKAIATGAYIIKTVNGLDKLSGIIWSIKAGVPTIDTLIAEKPQTLAHAQQILLHAPYLGSFMAAQLVADMKYTPLLANATDWHTWAAPGPGSRRGLNLLCGRPLENNWNEEEWLDALQILREAKLVPMFKELGWEIPHAQDVQNMLCEFSKYHRGFCRNKFTPSAKDENMYS